MFLTHDKGRQLHLAAVLVRAHEPARPLVARRAHRRICRSRVAFLLNTAPMKCLKGPVPRVVATASGEAAADQEMAHLLLAQELSGISRSEELLTPLRSSWLSTLRGRKTSVGHTLRGDG